jgi:hypothetical protein
VSSRACLRALQDAADLKEKISSSSRAVIVACADGLLHQVSSSSGARGSVAWRGRCCARAPAGTRGLACCVPNSPSPRLCVCAHAPRAQVNAALQQLQLSVPEDEEALLTDEQEDALVRCPADSALQRHRR